MKKNRLLCLFFTLLIGFYGDLHSQIIIKKFVYKGVTENNNLLPELSKFKSDLTTELFKYYAIYEEKFDENIEESNLSKIKDIFTSKLQLKFSPAEYFLKCYIEPLYLDNPCLKYHFFNIKIELIQTQTRKILPIPILSIPSNNLEQAPDIIARLIKNTFPSFYKINSFINNETFTINYGTDRMAQEGDELEINDENNDAIGRVEIISVNNNSSKVKLLNYFHEDDLEKKIRKSNFTKFYLQNILNTKKETVLRNELKKLKEDEPANDCGKKIIPPQILWHEAINFTSYVFKFELEEFSQYFNNSPFTPLIFGFQWTIIPSKFLGVFIDGKTSLYSTIEKYDAIDRSVKSKFLFYQYGAGLKLNLPISNFFNSGVAVSVKSHTIVLKKLDNSDIIISEENISSISPELKVYASLRFYDYFGIYGEMNYQFYPNLKSATKEWSSNALSLGLGISIYIKDK